MTNGKCCAGCKVVTLVVGVGALNWGLVALWNLNLVARVLGTGAAAKAAYVLIGIAGALKLLSLVKACPCCKGGSCETKK
ncbi:MAG: DUF378 domain-containing protein [Candidatus Omnitrophica bacterium]|nr:DUF378 domain-containing protein [Candidatus Omnitrophota bacterium]